MMEPIRIRSSSLDYSPLCSPRQATILPLSHFAPSFTQEIVPAKRSLLGGSLSTSDIDSMFNGSELEDELDEPFTCSPSSAVDLGYGMARPQAFEDLGYDETRVSFFQSLMMNAEPTEAAHSHKVDGLTLRVANDSALEAEGLTIKDDNEDALGSVPLPYLSNMEATTPTDAVADKEMHTLDTPGADPLSPRSPTSPLADSIQSDAASPSPTPPASPTALSPVTTKGCPPQMCLDLPTLPSSPLAEDISPPPMRSPSLKLRSTSRLNRVSLPSGSADASATLVVSGQDAADLASVTETACSRPKLVAPCGPAITMPSSNPWAPLPGPPSELSWLTHVRTGHSVLDEAKLPGGIRRTRSEAGPRNLCPRPFN
eukprot:gene7002-101_t